MAVSEKTANLEYEKSIENSTMISNSEVKKFLSRDISQDVTAITLSEDKEFYWVESTKSHITNTGDFAVKLSLEIDAYTGDLINSIQTIKINGEIVKEASDELFLVTNNEVRKISNLAYQNKYNIREKACRLYAYPMLSTERIRQPTLDNSYEFAIQVKKEYEGDFERYLLPPSTSEEYDFIIIKSNNLRNLLDNPLIIKICDLENIKIFIEHLKEYFYFEADEMIKNSKLKNTIFDVEPELSTHLSNDHWEVQPGQESVYQQFITPNDETIIELANTLKTPKDAYDIASKWVWVSDVTLHGKVEKWLKPSEFLKETPTYPKNPIPGRIVSDCSEQANTYVSILRAMGVSAEDVRVVIGEVEFDDEIGGHAWVEIWTENGWMPLDVTSGSYYDDDSGTLVTRNAAYYEYWMYHPYPVVEIWAYYNDQYYVDYGEDISSKWSENYDYESLIEATINAGLYVLESVNYIILFISVLVLATIIIISIKKHNKIDKN
jgi:hypothetical protein